MRYTILLQVAYTHLTARIKQSVVAGLGVTFGIGMFIILVSFMTGLNGLLDGLILNRTPHIHLFNEVAPSETQPLDLVTTAEDWTFIRSVKPKQKQARIRNASTLLDHIKADERVRGATAQVASQIFYKAGAIDLNGIITGVDIVEEDRLFNIGDYIIEGQLEALQKNDLGIILGAGVADKMSLGLGDRVRVLSAQGNTLTLKIVALYQSGMAEVDDLQSYANLNAVQRLLGQGASYITDINIKLNDIERSPAMAKELQRLHDVTAIDIFRANAQFDTGTAIRNLITYAVSIALLIVAGFGIYNILNMMIFEKMDDIAILKATGFSGHDVQLIFMIQALAIGIVGGIVGLLLGYGVSVLIDNTPFKIDALPTITTYPVNFDFTYYLIGIAFAIISTFLAGYLPARKAKMIDPVEVLRGK